MFHSREREKFKRVRIERRCKPHDCCAGATPSRAERQPACRDDDRRKLICLSDSGKPSPPAIGTTPADKSEIELRQVYAACRRLMGMGVCGGRPLAGKLPSHSHRHTPAARYGGAIQSPVDLGLAFGSRSSSTRSRDVPLLRDDVTPPAYPQGLATPDAGQVSTWISSLELWPAGVASCALQRPGAAARRLGLFALCP
jgi:hypothetical protein